MNILIKLRNSFKIQILDLFFTGVDVTANQEEISDHETFQMEFDTPSKRWYMRTMQDKYFTLQPGGGVRADEHKRYFSKRLLSNVNFLH